MDRTKNIKVALVDDHILLRSALANLINNFGDCRVTHQSDNGQELIKIIAEETVPDVAILDLNMPVMDGLETAEWLKAHFPSIKVMMLTMYDSELALIRLLQAGVKGFLKKDIHPSELKFAIHSVVESGFYYSNHTTGKLVNLFRRGDDSNLSLEKALLSIQECEFLQLVCTDLTYKGIAIKMGLNPRTVDNLRDALFNKLDVKSRVGLAMFAIRHGIARM